MTISMNRSDKILDALLVLNYQNGHKKSLAILVKRWHGKFCKHTYYYTMDIDIAKDIAQESWKIIIKKINRLEDPNKFGSWALSIVNRKAIDWLRMRKREAIKLKDYFNSEYEERELIDQDMDEIQKLKRAILLLPEGQRLVLNLFYTESYTILEIGEILGLSKGTIKSRLFYAREKLKLIIKNRNHE